MPQPSDHFPVGPSPNQPARNHFPGHVPFSQRNGYEPLPEPMRLEYISDDLRREICNAVCEFLSDIHTNYNMIDRHRNNLADQERSFIACVLGKINKVTQHQIKNKIDRENCFIQFFEEILINEQFNKVLDLLEIMITEMKSRYLQREKHFTKKIIELFDRHSAAYQLDTSQHPYWFFPLTSKEEGKATQQAIETVCQGKMSGAITHIRKAGKFMNKREYADSIRESIHAVESVARIISPASSKNLGPVLKSLENAGLHKALIKGFNNIYGYTNDEEGIRHPLLDQSEADVGLDEAIFMFGACASFAAYLTRKHQN